MYSTNLNLTSIIELIYLILLHSVIYISHAITIFAIYFNIFLQVFYESFLKKLTEHKSKIEENIKDYIKIITEDLTRRKHMINRFIEKINNIQTQIENFEKNYGKIGDISSYNTLKSIIQDHVTGDIGTIYEIFRTLVAYRNDLRAFHKDRPKLFNYMNLLKLYSQEILKIENNDSQQLRDYTAAAHRTLGTLEGFKAYLNQFNEHVKKAKLQEISNHIKTLKSKSNQVRDKINPQFKKHIHGLYNIDFDYTEFEKLVTKVNKFNNRFFEKYKIANNAIQLYKSVDLQTSKLGDVTFTRYDINELIKNSTEIKQRLESFKTISLTSSTSTTNRSGDLVSQINTIEKQYSSEISSYKSYINYLLYEISVLINTYYLLQIIILYSIKISEIPTKIKEMDYIDKALRSLPEIFKDLNIVYRVHNICMNILIVFNSISFARYYINKYILNFIMVNYYCEVLIFSILCYFKILSLLKFLQDVLREIKSKIPELIPESREIKILSAFTTNTNSYLKSIQCNIESLNTLGDNLSIDNLKYNLVKIRTTIDKISDETNQVKNNIKFINRGVTKLIIINFKIIYIKKYINIIIKKIVGFIGYLYFYYILIILFIEHRYIKWEEKTPGLLIHSNSIVNVIENLQNIIKYLNGTEKVVDDNKIRIFINNIESQIKNIGKLIEDIDKYNKIIDKSVKEVECAIQGVTRNFILCSLQSLTRNIINLDKIISSLIRAIIINLYTINLRVTNKNNMTRATCVSNKIMLSTTRVNYM